MKSVKVKSGGLVWCQIFLARWLHLWHPAVERIPRVLVQVVVVDTGAWLKWSKRTLMCLVNCSVSFGLFHEGIIVVVLCDPSRAQLVFKFVYVFDPVDFRFIWTRLGILLEAKLLRFFHRLLGLLMLYYGWWKTSGRRVLVLRVFLLGNLLIWDTWQSNLRW